jgi:hypothetical protein
MKKLGNNVGLQKNLRTLKKTSFFVLPIYKYFSYMCIELNL